jgi:uncharacterized protein (TIGR02594 family)
MPTSEVLPEWYEIAIKEIGVKEYPGSKHNARIIEYHQTCTMRATSDEIAWCAAFVNWCLLKGKSKGTNFANARSYLKWGVSSLKDPKKGDVCIFWRTSPDSTQGHVGFYAGETKDHILVLSGNQGNEVCIMKYSKTRLLDIRQAA